MLENWTEIPNTGGLYEASTLGRVRSKDKVIEVRSRWGGTRLTPCKGRVLKPWTDGNGYLAIYICGDGRRDATNVHRLVAETYHGAANGRHVNHINGDKTDNRPENLQWCTRAENMAHARDTGLLADRKPVRATPINGDAPVCFEGVNAAARALGLKSNANISGALNGRLKTSHGYRWEYLEAA